MEIAGLGIRFIPNRCIILWNQIFLIMHGLQWWRREMPRSDSLKTQIRVRDNKSPIRQNSCRLLQSSPKEVHIDFIQFPWWPWITDPDPGSYWVCQVVLGVIWGFEMRSFANFSQDLRPIDKIKMTWGRGQWSTGSVKLGWFPCAKHSEKSVV